MTGNTLACRYYHAGVAASYLPGGAQAGATGAAGMVPYHCGHVLGTATMGGCGYVSVAPTPATTTAPTPKSSTGAAAALSIVASGFALAASVFVL